MISAPAMTAARTTAAVALPATLGLAAGCWVVSVWQMTGMDLGVATRLGSFGFFAAAWVTTDKTRARTQNSCSRAPTGPGRGLRWPDGLGRCRGSVAGPAVRPVGYG